MSCDHDLVRYDTMEVCDVCGESELDIVKAENQRLKEQVRRLMEVSQHSLSEEKYLKEVGLYKERGE